jgi:hypothetical protein
MKTIEDKAQEYSEINDDKAANNAFCYNKYDIAIAFEEGAEFGYKLALERIERDLNILKGKV